MFIALVGCGLVGKQVLAQLAYVPNAQIILIANSKRVYYTPDYSAIELGKALDLVADQSKGGKPLASDVAKYIEYLESAPGPVTLLDCTADDGIAAFYPAFLKSGRVSIATPNKRAFSGHLSLYEQIQDAAAVSGALLQYESTVGAGLPVICTIKDLLATGDRIKSIQGVFSGTLSYIFNNWSAPGSTVAFSEVVGVAKEKGYTEPDPRDDLNGVDVARKLTILSRLVGMKTEHPLAFPVQSLIPKQLESCTSGDEFMSKLSAYDAEMESIRGEAAKEGKVIRFVGSIQVESGQVRVGMDKFDTSHPFANLTGSDNIICITSERYPSPLIIQGAGAGAAVTAMGVVADIIRIIERKP